MEKLVIEPTKTTPMVYCDPLNGVLEIKGRSSPENSIRFYYRIIQIIKDFEKSKNEEIVVTIAFEYFNTSSSKCLFDIFKNLIKVKKKGKEITINWYYEPEDEDMMEAGEDYSDLLKVRFNFIEIEED